MTPCCNIRDGAHEWTCSRVGEYDYVHCRSCDVAIWMREMAYGMCRSCMAVYEASTEHQEQEQKCIRRWMYERTN